MRMQMPGAPLGTVILAAFILTSCISNKPFRLGSRSIMPPTPHANFSLAFIEFDDMGEFWERPQLEKAVDELVSARQRGPNQALVVVFIHGWKNNASDDSGNVWGFREELKEMVDAYPDMPVVGVYIG